MVMNVPAPTIIYRESGIAGIAQCLVFTGNALAFRLHLTPNEQLVLCFIHGDLDRNSSRQYSRF